MGCVSAGVVLVTDAMAAMGLSDGLHSLGSLAVDVNNGSARLSGTSTLAGRYIYDSLSILIIGVIPPAM